MSRNSNVTRCAPNTIHAALLHTNPNRSILHNTMKTTMKSVSEESALVSSSDIDIAITKVLALEKSQKGGIFSLYDCETGSLFQRAKPRAARTVPTRDEITYLVNDKGEALKFLEECRVIDPVRFCPHCTRKLTPMSTKLSSKSRFVLRCRSRKCTSPSTFSVSALQGSILANCRFSKAVFIDLVYMWLINCKAEIIRKSTGMSPKTITDWSNYLREAVAGDLLHNDDCQIGGPGVVVEIDESKFGKRKYHVSVS